MLAPKLNIPADEVALPKNPEVAGVDVAGVAAAEDDPNVVVFPNEPPPNPPPNPPVEATPAVAGVAAAPVPLLKLPLWKLNRPVVDCAGAAPGAAAVDFAVEAVPKLPVPKIPPPMLLLAELAGAGAPDAGVCVDANGNESVGVAEVAGVGTATPNEKFEVGAAEVTDAGADGPIWKAEVGPVEVAGAGAGVPNEKAVF